VKWRRNGAASASNGSYGAASASRKQAQSGGKAIMAAMAAYRIMAAYHGISGSNNQRNERKAKIISA